MRLAFLILVGFLIGSFSPVTVVNANILQAYQQQKLQTVGKAEFRWLDLDLYTAKLLSPNGLYSATEPLAPLALELTYQTSLNGATVAKTTLQEMQRLGFNNPSTAAKWRLLLTNWFAGIKPGTRLAAIRNAGGSTTFIRNGSTTLGTIESPTFAKYFFAIWLSEQTQRPALRNQLIGLR